MACFRFSENKRNRKISKGYGATVSKSCGQTGSVFDFGVFGSVGYVLLLLLAGYFQREYIKIYASFGLSYSVSSTPRFCVVARTPDYTTSFCFAFQYLLDEKTNAVVFQKEAFEKRI